MSLSIQEIGFLELRRGVGVRPRQKMKVSAAKKGEKNQNFPKSLCKYLRTPKTYLWSKFEVKKVSLALENWIWIILRYCAISAQNPFSGQIWRILVENQT